MNYDTEMCFPFWRATIRTKQILAVKRPCCYKLATAAASGSANLCAPRTVFDQAGEDPGTQCHRVASVHISRAEKAICTGTHTWTLRMSLECYCKTWSFVSCLRVWDSRESSAPPILDSLPCEAPKCAATS